MPWPAAHETMLRECHRNGISVEQTAEALNKAFGTQYSKGAVSGRRYKLGLTVPRIMKKVAAERLKAEATQPAPLTPPPAEVLPPTEAIQSIAPLPIEPPASGPFSLLDLRHDMCRFPIGERVPFLFCGAIKAQGYSYCAAHARLTHNREAGRR